MNVSSSSDGLEIGVLIFHARALFMSFKLGVLIALFVYSFRTVGAYPSIYIVDLEKLGVLEHPKHPR